MKHIKLYEAFQQLPKGVEEVDYDEYNEITHAKDTRLPFSKKEMQEVKELVGQMFHFDPEPLGHTGLYFMLYPTKEASEVVCGYFSNIGNNFYLLQMDLNQPDASDFVRYKSDSLQQLIVQYMDSVGWKPEWTKIR